MLSPDITPEILAAHADLSAASRLFVESIERYPEWLLPGQSPRDFPEDFSPWSLGLLYPMQAWPTLVGREKIAEIESAVAGITALVNSVPTRIFDGDPERIARYFNDRPARVALMYEPPDLTPMMVARTDFLISPRGIQFLEVNLSSKLGGFSLRFWERFYRSRPAFVEFIAEHGLTLRYRDPLSLLYRNIAHNAVQVGLAAGGEVNMALVVAHHELEGGDSNALQFLRGQFLEALEATAPGLTGTVVFGAFPESFEVRRGKLFLRNGKRVHVLYEYATGWVPFEAYLLAKAGAVLVYNGPVQRFGGDKRCLSLLSEHAASGRFDERERSLIERYVPWGRDLVPGTVEYRGERHDLGKLLRRERESFVLKKGWSFEGRDVLLGAATPQEAWERTLDEAMAAGGWLVQERVVSRPYLYQAGSHGAAPHSVVWGTFCIAGAFGGGFLRMAPQGQGDGIINSARGATEGYIFEI